MTNPFIPAEWGKEYNLAGAVWHPDYMRSDGMVGTIVVGVTDHRGATDGRVWRIASGRPPDGKAWDGWRMVGSNPSCQLNWVNTLPLLPSPDWINEQTVGIWKGSWIGDTPPSVDSFPITPRAVAIAALERAGFYANDDGGWVIPIHKEHDIELEIIPPHPPSLFVGYIQDPDLAQFAVDCLKVLSAWASKVEWGEV